VANLPIPRTPTVVQLGPPDLTDAFGFLDRDPVVNVYLLALILRDALGRPQDAYLAVRRDGELVGLAFLGGRSGAVLPAGDDPEAMRRLGDEARLRLSQLPRRFQVIGARDAVDPFLASFGRAGIQPRLDRAQVYMTLDANAFVGAEAVPELRPATPADRTIVFRSGAALRREELEEDPLTVDPEGYARRVEEELRDGHTYVWLDEHGLRFRASISARTAEAVQISGVYVPPERRNLGFARRGVAELCRRSFERSRTACLFVNDFNAPALAAYRRIGFTPRIAWRSVFYDSRG
jgi:ribosomal protein S18 acetylase RimI-like enzyme